ncbi:MAG: thioesterase [Eubacteriales bacterium]
MITYNKEFVISFRDVDGHGNLRIHALVDFMQDTAREAATALGVNFETPDVEYYWIIIRSKINMTRIPKIDEKIRIETHYSGADRLYAVREFHIYDQDQAKIGDITAYYLLMEHGKTRPVKIKGNPNFTIFDQVYTGEKVEKLVVSQAPVVRSVNRQVFSSDIDVNGHMNNAHYVRWCFDMYENRERQASPVQSFQIQYVKEMLEHTQVTVQRHADGTVVGADGDTVHFIGKIYFE